MKILVVDDDASTQFLLRSRLTSWGYEVDTAADGASAWSLLQANRFDLVISDWNMPQMDGLALCRLIRQRPDCLYRYVILCTGNNQKSDFFVGMEAGADDFITKPIDAAELRVRVHAAERILRLQLNLEGQNRTLKRLNDELSGAYRTIQRDLQAAAAMQRRLLPVRREIKHRVRLDWLVIPSSFLAGDMLNYFVVADRYLVFYVLDVSGHGTPAALLSITLNRALLPDSSSPVLQTGPDGKWEPAPPTIVVEELNRKFQASDDEYFTMVYGVLDIETGNLRFCQAGHPPPIVLRRSGPEPETLVLGTGGFPVGMWPKAEYEENCFDLQPGDRLIVYSDGVTECRNPEGDAYSQERLEATLLGGAQGSLEDLMRLIEDDLTNWRSGAEFSDDLSMILLEVPASE